MSRRPRKTRRAPAPASDTAAVALSPAAQRLAKLLDEQRKLIARVARRRAALTAMEDRIRTLSAAISDAAAPLYARMEAIDREIHASFTRLLAPGHLPARAAAKVRSYLRQLHLEGSLFLPEDEVQARPARSGGDAPPDELPSAPPPAVGHTRGQLREIFRSLAKVLHPDRAVHAADATGDLHERAQAMQELNRAYEDRDLARLLELQRRWQSAPAPATPAAEASLEERCQTVVTANRELLKQYRELDRRWRALAQSDLGEIVRRGGPDPVASFVAGIEDEAQDLIELRDHVRAFEAGEIDVEELVAGPGAAELEEILARVRKRM